VSRCRQVSFAVQIRRPWSSVSTISVVEVLRPTWSGRATPVTQPSVAARWCVHASSRPTGNRSGSACSAESVEPRVSASTPLAPPCIRPYGWRLPATGIRPTTSSRDRLTISIPIFSASCSASISGFISGSSEASIGTGRP
jgi:hypothetical protein